MEILVVLRVPIIVKVRVIVGHGAFLLPRPGAPLLPPPPSLRRPRRRPRRTVRWEVWEAAREAAKVRCRARLEAREEAKRRAIILRDQARHERVADRKKGPILLEYQMGDPFQI